MDNNQVVGQKSASSRITSIDSLRALILFGILLVHTLGGFGFNIENSFSSPLDRFFDTFISYLLSDKCYVVFNVLFGVSFYLILKKPSYPSKKFIWRCVLLFCFGLFNKRFYTPDALCWYAFWGVILVAFRRMSPKFLFVTIIGLKVVGLFMPLLGIGDLFPGNHRYEFSKPFYTIVVYRHAIRDYLAIVLSGSVFGCLTNFLIGYCIGKMGWIERLEELVTKRLILISFVIYAALFATQYLFGANFGLLGLSAGFFYSLCILYAYYHFGKIQGVMRYLESYGKLGLTNYSAQGIFGVMYVYFLGQKTLEYGFSALLLVMVCFYICQAVFSHYWLKKHKYGPLEYLWRSLTEMKFLGNRKTE